MRCLPPIIIQLGVEQRGAGRGRRTGEIEEGETQSKTQESKKGDRGEGKRGQWKLEKRDGL